MDCRPLGTPILDDLFVQTRVGIEQLKSNLIQQNGALTGDFDGFLYRGHYYTELPSRRIKTVKKSLIAPALREQAGELYAAEDLYERERLRASNGLTTILHDCMSYQDVRDMIPLFVLKAVKSSSTIAEIAALDWRRPQGFLYAGQPLKQFQYETTIALLELHASNQIL